MRTDSERVSREVSVPIFSASVPPLVGAHRKTGTDSELGFSEVSVPVFPPLVGAHMSIAGGVWRAFDRAREVRANCLQVFVKSNVQWRFPVLTDEDVAKFKAEELRAGITSVVAHACYLVNPASPDKSVFRRSVEDLVKECEYASRYRIPILVLHSGNGMGLSPARGRARVAEALREVLARTRGVELHVEIAAGSGTAVCWRFEHAADIIEKAGGRRLGLCLDTSHAFAAGYDIPTAEGYAAMKDDLRRLGLLPLVKVIHANDSKAPLASRVDRHTHIGRGFIGRKGFRRVMTDPDFRLVPKILETPKGMCGSRSCDALNISLLRRLARP